MKRPMTWRAIAGALLGVMVVAACSSDDQSSPRSRGLSGFEVPADGTIGVQVASYEPVAGGRQRFIIGLVAGQGELVGFGTVRLEFAYAGTSDAPLERTTVAFEVWPSMEP